VPLLRCERDVLAGIWATEERRKCDGYVDQEDELDCVDGVAGVWCVTDDGYGDTMRMLAWEDRQRGAVRRTKRGMAAR
jgi:hypothetical protein